MTKAMPFLQKAILLSYDPRRFRAGSFVFCRLYASEFFCEGTAYKLVSHAGIYSWCRIYKS